MTALPIHPAALLFPELGGDDLAALAEDIRERGLLHPIVRYQGQILDGRNRARACELAGVEPTFAGYCGDDPVGYVVSLNLHRRHLTDSQRTVIAARVANMGQGARTDLASIAAKSQEQAAKLFRVEPGRSAAGNEGAG